MFSIQAPLSKSKTAINSHNPDFISPLSHVHIYWGLIYLFFSFPRPLYFIPSFPGVLTPQYWWLQPSLEVWAVGHSSWFLLNGVIAWAANSVHHHVFYLRALIRNQESTCWCCVLSSVDLKLLSKKKKNLTKRLSTHGLNNRVIRRISNSCARRGNQDVQFQIPGIDPHESNSFW